MKYFESLETGVKKIYSTEYFSGDYNHKIYLMKANDDGSHKPKFYLRATSNINGVDVIQGYLYFYLDFEYKTSDFIGIKVHEEFRNLNISSLLVSLWIDLCLNNGIDFLGSNKKQRKPFLIYLLKTFGFEILDKSLYKSSKDVISICRREDDTTKLLLFKDSKLERDFRGTHICKEDNYEILTSLDGVTYLDDIIMPLQDFRRKNISYDLIDYDKANVKVKRVLKNHQK